MHNIKRFWTKYPPLLALIGLTLANNGCSRHMVPSQTEYREFKIDNTIPADTAFLAYYAPYKRQLEMEMGRIIGRSAMRLTKPGTAQETLLGNFFAEALLTESRKTNPDIDFSVGTKGGLRTELPKGDITVGDLFELMPFENELVVLDLSGESIKELAQFIAKTGGQPVAGLRMVIDDGQPQNIQIGGQPFDKSRTYRILTYDYLANGGDNIRGLDRPLKRINLRKKVRETLIEYIQQHTQDNKELTAQLDGRITFDE